MEDDDAFRLLDADTAVFWLLNILALAVLLGGL